MDKTADRAGGIRALDDGRLRCVANPEEADAFLRRLRGTPFFTCTIASTDTAEIPGISAAGETAEKRRYTAALDAEYLLRGRPITLPEIPRNPLGPPSPVVITKASLDLLGTEALIIDAGTRIPPRVPRLVLGCSPGRCITTGRALDLPDDFREVCCAAGRLIASRGPWVILAESVPGGTTSALSLLEGLGHAARGRVSSSMPGGNHELKERVVGQAATNAALRHGADGLEVACAVGDPMQPAVALMALEASLKVPVVLGGGTQMAAVLALALRLVGEGQPGRPENLALASTRWVAEDLTADLRGIVEDLREPVPAFAAALDFRDSTVPGLRAYEEGLVKEGVGAGAAAFAALLSGGTTHADLLTRIENLVRALDTRNPALGGMPR